jgi:hypothetical protein
VQKSHSQTKRLKSYKIAVLLIISMTSIIEKFHHGDDPFLILYLKTPYTSHIDIAASNSAKYFFSLA